MLRGFEHAQLHLAVVDQHDMAGTERPEDLRMRKMDAFGVARRRIGIQDEGLAFEQVDPRVGELPHAKLGALKVDEDADRAPIFRFERPDRADPLAHGIVAGMAHVDAEHIGARLEELGQDRAILRGRPQGREDLHAPHPSHCRFPLEGRSFRIV